MPAGSVLEFLEQELVSKPELESAAGADFFKSKNKSGQGKPYPAKYGTLGRVMDLGVEAKLILPICSTKTVELLDSQTPENLKATARRITDILYRVGEDPRLLSRLGHSGEGVKKNPTSLPTRNRTPAMMSFLLFGGSRPLDKMDAPVDPEWQKICEQWIIDFKPSTDHLSAYFDCILKNLFRRDTPSLVWDTLIQPKITAKDPEMLTFLQQKGGSVLFFSFSPDRIHSIIEAYCPEVSIDPSMQGFWEQYAKQHPDAACDKIQAYLGSSPNLASEQERARNITWILVCLAETSSAMADKVYSLIKDYHVYSLISKTDRLYFVMAKCYEISQNPETHHEIEKLIESFINRDSSIEEIWGVFWQQMVQKKRRSQGLVLLKKTIKSESDVAYLSGSRMAPSNYRGKELLTDYPELIDHAASIVAESNWGNYPVFFEKLIAKKKEKDSEEPENIDGVIL